MHILFDLDGTLMNPYEGIATCIRHALTALQVPVPPPAELAQWIGPPLQDSFMTVLHCPEQTRQAVSLYRDRFATVGLYENELYEGIPAMLRALQAEGHTLWISTSKPRIFAQKIAIHFGLQPFLAGVYGSELNGDRAHKAELIAHILQAEGLEAQTAVMVGDRHYDISGAQHNGMKAIGVTWGFGTEEELRAAGADQLCRQPTALVTQVRSLTSAQTSQPV